MELKICLKKIFRTPIKTLLFFLLLTITGTLLSLGVNLLINAKKANKNIQETYTSIAIPNFDIIKDDIFNKSKDLKNLKSKKIDIFNVLSSQKTSALDKKKLTDIIVSINKLYYQVLEQASETKIGNVELRNSYLGFSKDLTTLLLDPYLKRNDINEWSLSRNMVVFDVSYSGYRNIIYDKKASWYNPDIHEDIKVIIWKINKVVAAHSLYDIPDTIETYTTKSETDQRGLLEQGKRYLISGFVKNLKMKNESVFVNQKYVDTLNYFRENSFKKFSLDTNFNAVLDQESDGYFNSYIELKDDVDVFLNSVQGVKYKQLIENCQNLNQATDVISINNLNAVLHFNQKKAYIINGREITAEEYEQGENVCLVGWKYAELNNLKVGDEIKLSLTNAKYEYYPYFDIRKESVWFLSVDPYSTLKHKEQSFKIVGIYQTPKWEVSEFMLSPNTVFVPSKAINRDDIVSVDKKTENFVQIPTSLYSIIIPNNKMEEFKDEMEQKGIGKYFLYYDQGYSTMKSVIKVITQNAVIILSVCFVVWLLVLILFILLYVVKEKKIAGIMLSLGVGARRTFINLILSCILLALPSAIIGGFISNALNDEVTKLSYDIAVNQVMDSSFDRTFSANADTSYNALNEESDIVKENIIAIEFNGLTLIMQFLQFIIILCLSSVYIYLMLRKKPMELVKGKE